MTETGGRHSDRSDRGHLARRASRKLSKRKSRRRASGVLIFLAFLAVLGAIHFFRARTIGLGFDYLAFATCSVAATLVFVWPVQCRVITTRDRECKKEAYGVLFGCHVRGHGLGKFRARFGRRMEPTTSVATAAQSRAGSTRQLAPEEALAIVVTVAGGGMGLCAFWFGLISTAAGVASVALAAVQLR
jgi:hypothetical protein